MTPLDWGILIFTLAMAVWGYAQGLLVGALSLAGLAAGAFLGSRLGPLVLSEGAESPYAPVATLVGALLLGGMVASGLELLGFQLRRRLGERLGVLDGLGGSLLIGCLGLGLVWIVAAVALQTPGARELRPTFQRSAVVKQLNDVLPPSGGLLNALARFDPFPRVPGPDPGVRPPEPAIARDPQIRAVAGSVVKILGTACGLGVEGSGWVAGDGIVVTNAHVVAGQDDTTVQVRGEGERFETEPVWYDSTNDLAILRAPGIAGVPALQMNADAPYGSSGAVLGFPENGPYDVQPARLGKTEKVISKDSYGNGPVQRKITAVRALVRSGNSGGPMVDDRGRVVTTIFAAAIKSGSGSGFGVPDTVVRDALGSAGPVVDTGACAK